MTKWVPNRVYSDFLFFQGTFSIGTASENMESSLKTWKANTERPINPLFMNLPNIAAWL